MKRPSPQLTTLADKPQVVVLNKLGIHARPAAQFVRAANKFKCDIFVEKDGEKVNGKSIMGLMMLAAGPGSKLLLVAEGEDAARADCERAEASVWNNTTNAYVPVPAFAQLRETVKAGPIRTSSEGMRQL